jgi:GTP-binding protein Era
LIILLNQIIKHLPEGEPIFGEDELTDQSMRTIVAEMVREKILQTTGEEIPYVTAVVTEKYDETDPNLTRIYCAIYRRTKLAERNYHRQTRREIKKIGTEARVDIEKLLGKKVYLSFSSKSSKTGATLITFALPDAPASVAFSDKIHWCVG